MKSGYAMMFLFLGLALRISPALDIIHELMHYGFCNIEGIRVLELNWSSIIYARSSISVLYGGYYGELMLYAFLTILFSKKVISGFFLGILIIVYLVSFGSLDFNEYALRYYGDPAKVEASLVRWGILATVVLGFALTVFIKGLKDEK